MGVSEGVCDWCGRGRLMETGDESSLVQHGKLWCGSCREGSKARYERFDDDWLRGQIEITTEMLSQHPLQWEAPFDHPRMHMFKLGHHDEVCRMERELEFRNVQAD